MSTGLNVEKGNIKLCNWQYNSELDKIIDVTRLIPFSKLLKYLGKVICIPENNDTFYRERMYVAKVKTDTAIVRVFYDFSDWTPFIGAIQPSTFDDYKVIIGQKNELVVKKISCAEFEKLLR